MGKENDQAAGWLFLAPGCVPERWQPRAIPASLIPLLPEEAADLLAAEAPAPRFAPEEDAFVHLVATGAAAGAIARELHLAPRTVYRRLERLRRDFGVGSTAELAAELARRGF